MRRQGRQSLGHLIRACRFILPFGLNGAKVYGLSATEVKKYTSRDHVAQEKVAYQERPEPHFMTYGPRTRREFLALRALEQA